MKLFITLLGLFISLGFAQTNTPILLEVNTGRTEGIFSKVDVFQRAILLKPDKPYDTALLFYRGWSGIANIKNENDWARNLNYLKTNTTLFSNAGIALVVMDCPTDQIKFGGFNTPMACSDEFRSSEEHASDVEKIIAILKSQYGVKNIYVMGHSYGTISSKWLAKRLGNKIQGSIHSAAMTRAAPNNRLYGGSVENFDMASLKAPVLNIHNRDDACRQTPYDTVVNYSRNNLVTVIGGDPVGDVCGGTHLHSMGGREEVTSRAIIKWIKTGQVEAVVGE